MYVAFAAPTWIDEAMERTHVQIGEQFGGPVLPEARRAQQIVEAFPWDDVPRYLLWDRAATHGT
jgi:hypothetical protein